jgi:hypothetical protein
MKRQVSRTLRILIVLNILVVALLAGTMVADWLRILPSLDATAGASPTPRSSIELMEMGLAHIPTSNSCLLCHTEGGDAGIKPIPALGHPVEGWTACLTCHTGEKLGRNAPGHDGIAETECLNCHKVAPDGPTITQAHAKLEQPCLECHGSVAHLPTSMVGRNQDECWLCHKPNPSPPPVKPHPAPQDLTCRECHQSADVGSLPIDHALRLDTTCVYCHDVQPALNPRPRASADPSLPPPGG